MSTKEDVKVVTSEYGIAYAALTKAGIFQLTMRWDFQDGVSTATHIPLRLVEGEVHTILPKQWYKSVYIPAHNIGRQYEID